MNENKPPMGVHYQVNKGDNLIDLIKRHKEEYSENDLYVICSQNTVDYLNFSPIRATRHIRNNEGCIFFDIIVNDSFVDNNLIIIDKILYHKTFGANAVIVGKPEFPQNTGPWGENLPKSNIPKPTGRISPNMANVNPCPKCGTQMRRKYWLFGEYVCDGTCMYGLTYDEYKKITKPTLDVIDFTKLYKLEIKPFIKDLEFELNCIKDLDNNNRSELVNDHLDIIIKICQQSKR